MAAVALAAVSSGAPLALATNGARAEDDLLLQLHLSPSDELAYLEPAKTTTVALIIAIIEFWKIRPLGKNRMQHSSR